MNDSKKIKQEFEEKIKTIEKTEQDSQNFKIYLLYTASIVLFVAILVGTIFSIKNYIDAKNNPNTPAIPKITIKG